MTDNRADFKDSLRQLAKEVLPDDVKPVTPTTTVELEGAAVQKSVDRSKPHPRPKSTGRDLKRPRPQISSEPNVITVTTRYPKDIDTLITKASFAQRMNELEPGTKQDILVEAARDWLRHNGYLSRGTAETEEREEENQAA